MRAFPYRLVWFVVLAFVWCGAAAPEPSSFRFIIIGDRTGEATPGVYDEVWKELTAEKPAFIVSVGDTIEGDRDSAAEAQWQEMQDLLLRWKQFPLYLAPGNHDVWSAESARLFTKYSGHPLHYSFDYGQAHFTILDNSRSEGISPDELAFLDGDLQEHEKQSLKVIVSHRPSWIVNAIVGNPDFDLQRIAKKHGVRYVIAGHVHEMLHADLDGVTYVSMPSAGGHLRGERKYEEGSFYGYTAVDVSGGTALFRIQELNGAFGAGRKTGLSDWGKAGLFR
jgi:3',5'-cyclic-AMP phosphodiesterase